MQLTNTTLSGSGAGAQTPVAKDVQQPCYRIHRDTSVSYVTPLEHAVWERLLSFRKRLLFLTVLPEVDNLCCLVEQEDFIPARARGSARPASQDS